jgi:hypothetical protein
MREKPEHQPGDRVRLKRVGALVEMAFPGADAGTVTWAGRLTDEDCSAVNVKFDNGLSAYGAPSHRFEAFTASREQGQVEGQPVDAAYRSAR